MSLPVCQTPEFVKVAAEDRARYLSPPFFTNPYEFLPTPGPLGQVHSWGLYEYGERNPIDTYKDFVNHPEVDFTRIIGRTIETQMMYTGDVKSPELQFVEALMEKKRKQIAAVDFEKLHKKDVILRIWLTGIRNFEGEHRIERRVRVSAGLKLGVFQDKILNPLFGWARNMHSYVFTDFRDGALFGPRGMSSIDSMSWKHAVGHDYLPDDEFTLADLIRPDGEGNVFGYLYDFGDKWFHEIEVVKILSLDESDGEVRVMNGRGQCPGENLQGNFRYYRRLLKIDVDDPRPRSKKLREILDSPNYQGCPWHIHNFNLYDFDPNAAEFRINAALSSPNSVRSGAKGFKIPLTVEAFLGTGYDVKISKSQVVQRDFEPGGFWQETKSTKIDSRKDSACALCGKPGEADMKTCSGCKELWYCDSVCQKRHWKRGHRKDCSRKHLDEHSGGGVH
ncbi:MM3350-like domain-containing protein [Flagelloscypha sp. PMI_526]|nr:MM3350-like domain-containing protein [Flagelloscypha sp. PMI_526]